jgi:hypothetical protein
VNQEMGLQLAKCEDAVGRTGFLTITASLEEPSGVDTVTSHKFLRNSLNFATRFPSFFITTLILQCNEFLWAPGPVIYARGPGLSPSTRAKIVKARDFGATPIRIETRYILFKALFKALLNST